MLPFGTDELTITIPKTTLHHGTFIDHSLQDLETSLPRKPRSAVKKARHSKIDTAHGTRDRRMRLSLEVARKFFNLQDTLGFDKASKTIEWLLTKSGAAIDELSTQEKKNPSLRKIKMQRESRERARERARNRVRCRREIPKQKECEKTHGSNTTPNSCFQHEGIFSDEIQSSMAMPAQESLLSSDDSIFFMNPNISYSNCVQQEIEDCFQLYGKTWVG